MLTILISTVSQSLLWSLLAIGVYLTFRLLDLPDLSAEGTYPLGAAICASLMTIGVSPMLATLAAVVGGMIAGALTGFLHTKMHIPPLLAGILVLTGLYSINLHIMGGRPNIALLGEETVYSGVQELLGISKHLTVIIIGSLALIIVVGLLTVFLHTEIGISLRSVGDNIAMSEANGIHVGVMKTLGYMLGNGIIALAGALIAQKDGYADINMGIGTIVIGLAAIIIAEVILGGLTIGKRLITLVGGSLIYRLIIDAILNQSLIDIKPTDLRLFSAILLTIVLWVPESKLLMQRWQLKGTVKSGSSTDVADSELLTTNISQQTTDHNPSTDIESTPSTKGDEC